RRGARRPVLLPQPGALRHRLGGARRGAHVLPDRAPLRAGSPAVRSSPRRLPARAAEARPHGDGDHQGPAPRLAARPPEGREHDATRAGVARQARERRRGARHRPARPRHPRRQRHRERVSGDPSHAEPRDGHYLRGDARHAHADPRARHHGARRDPLTVPLLRLLVWLGVALAGAWAIAVLAVFHGETVNAVWFIVAAAAVYALAYRFYGAFLAARLFALDRHRPTPAERLNDGRDFVPTNRWVVFGHHFAAIAGPGPLIGPILAAQFGYLPGALWILAGVVLAGAVQDFVILVASMRRDGRSLARLARDTLGPVGAVAGTLAILLIMVILIAILGIVIVNALAESPWGLFTVGCTIPIAFLMGAIMRGGHGKEVIVATAIGLA